MDCLYPSYIDVMFTSLLWLLDFGNLCRIDVILALAEAAPNQENHCRLLLYAKHQAVRQGCTLKQVI